MNQVESYRDLRRLRTRRIRRRVLVVCATVAVCTGAWFLLSRTAPPALRPPGPEAVGRQAAQQVAMTAADILNRGYAVVNPRRREMLKRRFLAMTGDTLRAVNDGYGGSFNARRASDSAGAPVSRMERMRAYAAPARAVNPIQILLIGIDARLGRERGRADALQLLTVAPDRSRLTITSIPRGTSYDLGCASPSENIISSVRSMRGRDALLRAVAKLCRVSSVPYYVEVGFSQAVGVLRLLGYRDPMQELQALRMRKAYARGDVDRSINQGRFLQRAIPRLLPKCEGLSGELLISAALGFVETNLDKEFCLGLLYSLIDAGVLEREGAIEHKAYGVAQKRLNDLDLPDDAEHAVGRADYSSFAPTGVTKAEQLLRRALKENSTGRARPRVVIRRLRMLFDQRGWQQIPAAQTRLMLRDSLASLLRRAYLSVKDTSSARGVESIIHSEEYLFRSPQF
jgi:hypothetical protein